MDWTGTVEAVYVAPEAESDVAAREAVEAVAGRGLRGDRYFRERGTFSGREGGGRDLTLIEVEALAAVEREYGVDLPPGAHRRNVATRNAALNHLVGEEFRVGDAVCAGVRLCEPCAHLESLTEEGAAAALKHRGGLRADVIETGTIRPGDTLEPI